MDYHRDYGGRVTEDGSTAGRDAIFWTFASVEERLVDAVRLWRRAPDRERGWQSVRSFWPEIRRHGFFGDGDGELNHAEEKPEARRPPLTRAEVAEMNAAGELLGLVCERDRRLVVIVLTRLSRDGASAPSWLTIWNRLGRGRPGPEGLRKRYSRAITNIANSLNS